MAVSKKVSMPALFLLFVGVLFLLLEVCLRQFSADQLHRYFNHEYDTYWELAFLERQGRVVDPMNALFQYDPELGQSLKVGAQIQTEGGRVSIHPPGIRGNALSLQKKGKRILVFGDSFTFGVDSPDGETWPELLQREEKNGQVMNLAVGGFGLDQMLLSLKKNLPLYPADLVIFAYTDVGLQRCLLSMGDLQRPRLSLQQGQLQRVSAELLEPAKLRQRLLEKYKGRPLLWTWFLDRLQTWRHRSDPQRVRELFPLGEAIVLEAQKRAQERGADFLLLHLARPSEPRDLGEFFADYLKREHPQFPLLLSRPFFQESGKVWKAGKIHYTLPESTVLAQGLTQFLGRR